MRGGACFGIISRIMNNQYYLIVGTVVVALAAIAGLVNYCLSIFSSIQAIRRGDAPPPRNPPLPEEIAKRYATKSELESLKAELKEERARVDGILKQQFDLIRGLTEKLNAKFSALESSLKDWQLGIERLIGKIEGKVESK